MTENGNKENVIRLTIGDNSMLVNTAVSSNILLLVKQRHRNQLIVLFGLAVCMQVFGGTNALETALLKARGAVPSTDVLGSIFVARTNAPSPAVLEQSLKACAAGLLYLNNIDGYISKLRPLIADADSFEESVKVPCDACKGGKLVMIICSACKRSGRCRAFRCDSGSIYIPAFDGNVIVHSCPKCKGSALCAECKGEKRIAVLCQSCKGGGKMLSPDAALAICWESIDQALNSMTAVSDGLETGSTVKSQGLPTMGERLRSDIVRAMQSLDIPKRFNPLSFRVVGDVDRKIFGESFSSSTSFVLTDIVNSHYHWKYEKYFSYEIAFSAENAVLITVEKEFSTTGLASMPIELVEGGGIIQLPNARKVDLFAEIPQDEVAKRMEQWGVYRQQVNNVIVKTGRSFFGLYAVGTAQLVKPAPEGATTARVEREVAAWRDQLKQSSFHYPVTSVDYLFIRVVSSKPYVVKDVKNRRKGGYAVELDGGGQRLKLILSNGTRNPIIHVNRDDVVKLPLLYQSVTVESMSVYKSSNVFLEEDVNAFIESAGGAQE